MKKHSQLKWLASLALGAGVLAAYGIHDAQAAYAALPADGTAGVVEQKEAQPLRWFTEKADAVGSSTPYGNNEKAGHYVQSGDARLYYEVYGKGTPVVVLHGGGVGTPYEWDASSMNSGRTMKSSSCRQEATAGQKSVIRL